MNKKRILLIDDEPSITRSMKTNLERTGRYDVRAENRAQLATAVAKDFMPHLIFLDVMMPNMDGSELSAKFKADPALAQIPLVFLTAIVSKAESGDQGLVSGGNRFLAKPMNLDGLVSCIESNT